MKQEFTLKAPLVKRRIEPNLFLCVLANHADCTHKDAAEYTYVRYTVQYIPMYGMVYKGPNKTETTSRS